MPPLPSRHTLRGYAVWAAVLLAVAVAGIALHLHVSPHRDAPLAPSETASLDSFRQAVAADSAARQAAWEQRYPQHPTRKYGSGHRIAESFPFDPNKADSATFLRLGLAPWQAHNALQYRRKGGKWRSAEHFSHLYGLSEADYKRLAPYVRIDTTALTAGRHTHRALTDAAQTERRYPEKLTPGSAPLDLNEADTTDLQRIPGIGSYRARLIVRYREQLGGFVSTSQLAEIQGLPEDIAQWVAVDPQTSPTRLNVNRATFQQLVRHPYLSYEQVREIANYRRRYGDLRA